MELIRKFRIEILILTILIAVYFVLRVPNLTLQPIFADEAIYIRWAQVMRAEPTLRFLPLSDGKTPLFMWVMIPLFKVIKDPLFAGRFLSVISGLFTLIGIYLLSRLVFGKKTVFFSSMLYTITPYTVFFDRMALVDSMLATFTIWSIYFAILLAKFVRLDLSMILGLFLGGGILTKTPGMVSLLILPLSALAFKRKKGDKYHLVRLVLFWGIAIGIGLVMYNLLRLGPNFHQLSARNADYVFAPSELIGRPLDPFIPHFRDMADWFPKLLTWPTLAVGFFGIIRVIWERNRLGFLVLLWGLIPIILEMAFLRTFTARYLLSALPPFLILGGYGVGIIYNLQFTIYNFKSQTSKNVARLILLTILLIPSLSFDYLLLTSPQKAPLPKAERIGYFEEWTAGYGFSQIADYLVERKKHTSVVVGTEGFFGTLPDGLQIYLDKAGIPIIGSHATVSAQLKQATLDNEVYFVANKSRLMEYQKNLKLIMDFPKAKSENGKQDTIQFFKVVK